MTNNNSVACGWETWTVHQTRAKMKWPNGRTNVFTRSWGVEPIAHRLFGFSMLTLTAVDEWFECEVLEGNLITLFQLGMSSQNSKGYIREGVKNLYVCIICHLVSSSGKFWGGFWNQTTLRIRSWFSNTKKSWCSMFSLQYLWFMFIW